MKVKLNQDIWDDGQDCHPPGCLAIAGSVLNVLNTFAHGYEVAHDGREHGFYVSFRECAALPETVETPHDKT